MQIHQNINPGVGRRDRGANLGNNQSCLQLHPRTTFPGANPHPCHHHLHHLKVDKVQQDLLSGSGPIQFCQSPPAGLWPAGEENQSRFFFENFSWDCFLRILREIVRWDFLVRLFDKILLVRLFDEILLVRLFDETFWWDCLMSRAGCGKCPWTTWAGFKAEGGLERSNCQLYGETDHSFSNIERVKWWDRDQNVIFLAARFCRTASNSQWKATKTFC